jgi:hypothetical protein
MTTCTVQRPLPRLPALLLAAAAAFVFAAPAARAEVVLIVSAKSSLAPSVEQACQVFLGKLKTPTPITLAEPQAARDEFYSKACKKDPAQVRAIWGKLIFTGTGTPPKEAGSGADMKKLVAGDPGSVGYIDKKDLDASVKVVATVN